jgi:hypothetical protein
MPGASFNYGMSTRHWHERHPLLAREQLIVPLIPPEQENFVII